MSITIDLTGQTALVTGASQGIGAEIARVLHAAGAMVILNHPDAATARPGPTRNRWPVLERSSAPAARVVHAADVRDPAAVEAMMRSIGTSAAGLDILVNNAGILRDRTSPR